MPTILLSAVSTAFLTVRVVKGNWKRNPQYLASAIGGSILAALLLHFWSPDADGDFVMGSLAGLAGAWGGMWLFDALVGREV